MALYYDFARAIDDARQDAQEKRGAMTRVEFDLCLAQAIRRGSIQAMKLWAELNVDTSSPPAEVDEFDELREKRARRDASKLSSPAARRSLRPHGC